MNLRPKSTHVLLSPLPFQERTKDGIWLVESNRWSSDQYIWIVVACGSEVPAEIQPGMRVLLDPTSLTQRDFEHEGRKFKVAPWREVKMLIGVEP